MVSWCKLLKLTSDIALPALEASHDAQALLAELEHLHSELQQALQRAAQQGERAARAEEELRGCVRDKEALAGSVAELQSRCGQLQVGQHHACSAHPPALEVTRPQQVVLVII
jgi:chromosome segregation ATPase